MHQTGTGPLAGMRVVELATVLMAPYATECLGDLGADVVKVEGARLDSGRLMGEGPDAEISGVALNLHRNKRSVQLDLKSHGGQNVMSALLACSDVFVTNLRSDALRRLGLDANKVCAANPSLVYCEAHGFRTGTDDEQRATFDDVIQAETGLTALTALLRPPPVFLPAVIADKTVGLFIAQAVLAAVVHKLRTGRGQRVEVPMFDAMLSFNLVEHLAGSAVEGGAPGYQRILSGHRGPHRTLDGHLAVMPYSDRDWLELYSAVGREMELAAPEFQTRQSRHRSPAVVYGSLARVLSERTTAEWVDLCKRLNIPFGRVESLDDIVVDPERHRGVIEEAVHPDLGPYRSIRSPLILDDSPTSIRRHAPFVGEHTVEVLRELEFGPGEITELLGSGAATQRTTDEGAA